MPPPEDLPRHSPLCKPRTVAQPTQPQTVTVGELPGGTVVPPAADQMSNTVSDATDVTRDEDYDVDAGDYFAQHEDGQESQTSGVPPYAEHGADISRLRETRITNSDQTWSTQAVDDRAFSQHTHAARSRGSDNATPTPTTEASHIADYHHEIHTGAPGAFAWGSTAPSQPDHIVTTAEQPMARRHIAGGSTEPFAPTTTSSTQSHNMASAPMSRQPTTIAAPPSESPPTEVAPRYHMVVRAWSRIFKRHRRLRIQHRVRRGI